MTVAEGHLRIVSRDDLVESRKRTVIQFHHDALQPGQRRRDLEEVKVHGLVRAEHLARCDSKCEGVPDLSGGAGDGDVQGWLHDGRGSFKGQKGRNCSLPASARPPECIFLGKMGGVA